MQETLDVGIRRLPGESNRIQLLTMRTKELMVQIAKDQQDLSTSPSVLRQRRDSVNQLLSGLGRTRVQYTKEQKSGSELNLLDDFFQSLKLQRELLQLV
ncbi:MAG: hypothetical protein Tsb009_31310 [Planctomycetaceae bacterium]